MCGISVEVHDSFEQVYELNHKSSMALRSWSGPSLAERKREMRECFDALVRENHSRTNSTGPGAGMVTGGKGKRQCPWRFSQWSNEQVQKQFADVKAQLDEMTHMLQEGKLTNGQMVARPYRNIPMWVGLRVSGFDAEWLNNDYCLVCSERDDIARCCRCQAGICQTHGCLLTRASQASNGAWQGASTACCGVSETGQCQWRQRRIIEFWMRVTGEELH